MQQATFNIYVMSCHRAKCITSHKFFDYCTVVVREEEKEEYLANGVTNLLVIPTGEVNNFMDTLYWIIDNTPEDVIYVCDDDVEDFMYRQRECVSITSFETGEPDTNTITEEVERIAQLIVDLKLGFACDNASRSVYAYNREIAFVGMPGHMRWINKECLKARYDKDDVCASDIDMAMQEMIFNRVIFQPRYFCVESEVGKNTSESRNEQKIFIENMKNKWGKYYGFDFKRNIASIKVQR